MRHYMDDPGNDMRLLKVPPHVVKRIKAEAYAEAVEAVKARCSSDGEFMCVECEASVAAIEALGGERVNDDQILGQHVRRVFTLTAEECDALWDAWVSIPWEQRKGALVGGLAYYGAINGAFALAVADVYSTANTSICAALALVCRDSRSESGPFTVEHYEVLTRPWRATIGAVHPDDDLPVGEAVITAQAVTE